MKHRILFINAVFGILISLNSLAQNKEHDLAIYMFPEQVVIPNMEISW
jgi:hypothetical protein